IEDRGGKHHRFQRGYKNVINEAKKLNKKGIYTPLAIETSGHAAFMDNYFLDDGAYMAALLLIQLVKSKKVGISFTDILNELKDPMGEKEIRFSIKAADFRESGNKVLDKLPEYVEKINGWELEKPNYEGVRVICDGNNWFLLRLSLHESLLCLNIETEEKGKVKDIEKKLYEFLKNYNEVDSSVLNN
ncbi:MAG: phosphomannomutase/phosphoglucomutase, partial [Pseudoleptotrichia goodfellowii]|nr:phosphomannomutase/phosphoglucomutase [Pseudoleptotrichia goodfellowii]